MHIENLYKAQEILAFKEVFALEKIHGSSAHVRWADGHVTFFAGGAKHDEFAAVFDMDKLTEAFAALGHPKVVVFGEAYGGKMQGMRLTYGPRLRFVAFEVKIGDLWLAVPQAEEVALALGLEFVAYDKIPATLEALDAHRALPSVQAVRNGMGDGHRREGDVLRPPFEVRLNSGERVVAKYKNEESRETKAPRAVDATKLAVLTDAAAVATEWVTQMRLTHVLDGVMAVLGREPRVEDMGAIIKAMCEDVQREGAGEIEWSRLISTAIGKATARMMKARLQATLQNEGE